MSWHNTYRDWLSETKSLQNGQNVVNYLYAEGKDWSKESICALIGNMRHESSINPNMYEYGYDWGSDRGFGLVQWTPRSKYWNWGVGKGYTEAQLRSGDAQLSRIDYEVDNNIQWIAKDSVFNRLTFKEFRTNSRNLSVNDLTEAFTWGYERPNAQAGASSMPARKSFANRAFKELNWTGGGGTPDPDPDPEPEPEPEPKPPEIDFSNVLKFFTEFGDNIVKGIEKMLIVNLYDYGKSKTFGNSFLKVDKTYSNMYKIKPTLNYDKVINDVMNDAKKKLDDLLGSLIPKPDPEPDPDPDPNPDPDPEPEPNPDNEMFFPVKITGGINFWTQPYANNSIQHGMDFGGPRSGRLHAGYDIGGGGSNHNIYAIRSGTVTFAGSKGNDRGLYIIIKHSADNKYTLYQHLQFGTNKVKTGDTVKAGQHIAQMGNSPGGYSIHLHLELNTTGVFNGWGTTENPRTYLKVTGNNKTSLPQPK